MTRGDAKDYNFGNKNNWRRTIWNEVLRRTDGREKQEPVLYLAGSGDHDRRIALNKGVPSSNLIAIDRCDRNVATVRANGQAAVSGDVYDVVRAWPADRPISALILDFCGGLPPFELMDQLEAMLMLLRPYRATVLAMNFLRGRDPASSWRAHCATISDEAMWGMIATAPSSANPQVLTPRHRAWLFTMHYALCLLFAQYEYDVDAYEQACQKAPLVFGAHVTMILSCLQPTFYSYKSGALVYDSVVLNGCGTLADITAYQNLAKQNDTALRRAIPVKPALRRQLSAVLAVRTRRMEA